MIPIDNTVARMVCEHPSWVTVFEKYQIDYCCNGKRPLREVCKEKGLPLEAITTELENATPRASTRDWTSAPLSELADFIVERHHEYLRATLPSIGIKLSKVREVHGQRHGNVLQPLQTTFDGLATELTQHMMKEEAVLFPFVARLERAAFSGAKPPIAPGGSVNAPIRMMEDEHESAGRALARLRELTEGYTPPQDACTTFRALYAQLSELETDLHQHIHLENNILFPRAAQLEKGLASAVH